MARYNSCNVNQQFSNGFVGILATALIVGIVYNVINHHHYYVLLCSLAHLALVTRVYFYIRNEKVEWLEIDDEGLRYKRGRKIYKVGFDERISLGFVRPYGEEVSVGGTRMILWTPHGAVQLDERIDKVDALIKELKLKWKL